MRRSIPLLIASLALAPLTMPFAHRVHADDAADDQSPAAKAYRDAWWAETGGGNLNQAIDGYAKAADADGPAPVKARALYRKAVVLQRIGKTEEAIRTLERLAKDHPGEAALQTDARARLAEWTAVDLKTSFADWYQRYQYSPEFQAKIVDLVLKLGSFDQAVGNAASQEILTIGAPAIPALRQHVESPNTALRERVITALLRLGEVPSMVSLRSTSGWRIDMACWATLKAASDLVRSRLKTEAKADEPFDQGLLALLDGPVAFLTWVGTPAAASGMASAFLSHSSWWDEKQPAPAEARPLLLGLVENQALTPALRTFLTYPLFQAKLVDAERAAAWTESGDSWLRDMGISFLADPRGGPDSQTALRRLLPRASTWGNDSQRNLLAAVLVGLKTAPSGDELDRLADDLLKVWSQQGLQVNFPFPVPVRAVLARMVDRARDPQVALHLFQTWQRGGGAPGTDLDRLAGWVRNAPSEDLRKAAIQALTNAPGGGQERALALLADAELGPDARFLVFNQLLVNAQPGSFLLADPASRRALLAALRSQESLASKQSERYVGAFNYLISRTGIEARRATAMEWLADPVAFPRSLLRSDYASSGVQPYMQKMWTEVREPMGPAWRNAWAAWTPVQRDAAIEGLDALFPSQDPQLIPFLRASVRDTSNGISTASRERILLYLDALALEDLRAAFDLSTTKGTDDAILVAFRKRAGNTPEPTPELFEALKLGLRPDGPVDIARRLLDSFRFDPRVQRPLLDALLAHKDEGIQESAVDLLAARESSDDLPLWLRALTLPSADVRAKAAAGLGRIAHPDATKALVKALDDPNSRVRDAAIASLEAIQKVEDLKRTWREKVR